MPQFEDLRLLFSLGIELISLQLKRMAKPLRAFGQVVDSLQQGTIIVEGRFAVLPDLGWSNERGA
jgi:hypothetical protein